MRKTLLLITCLAVLALAVVPSFAQNTTTEKSKTWTEAEINAAERVQNPPRNWSNLVVDLQAGQVTLSGTFTPTNANTTALNVSVTIVPEVQDGYVDWVLTSANIDAQLSASATVAQLNTGLANQWATYWNTFTRGYDITSVVITDSDITYTYVDTNPNRPNVPPIGEDGTITVTETQINDTFLVSNPNRPRVADVVVDLQPNQVMITLTATSLRQSQSYSVVAVIAPTVVAGDVNWSVVSLDVTGNTNTQAASSVIQSWSNYSRRHTPRVEVTAVTVTDNEIIYTVTPWTPPVGN